MAGNVDKGTSKDIFTGKGNAQVRQDNGASRPEHSASSGPAAVGISPRAPEPNPPKTAVKHATHQRFPQQKAVKVTLWVKPAVKDELERIARREETSLSATGSAFLEQALQNHIDMQYGALLRPIIEQAINARFRARDARFAALLVRIAHDAGQRRALAPNLLAPAPGVSAHLLEPILARGADGPRANLTTLPPKITDLIQPVE